MYTNKGGFDMKNMQKYSVFISSPSDLSEEREVIKSIVKNYKADTVLLDPILWEEKMPVTSGKSPQEIIIQELLSDSDILIGLFSSKFGTPTEKYASGTVEEIEIFINSGKKVILYFVMDKDTRNPSELSLDELDALKRIKQFKEKYAKDSIYKNIKIDDLKDEVERDLKYNIGLLEQKPSYTNNMNQNQQPQLKTEKIKAVKHEDKKYSGNWWADESISVMINEYIASKGLNAKYKGDLTFYENTQMIKDSGNFTESTNKNILQQAKSDAFSRKYGNFNYQEDLRDKYPSWSEKVRKKIQELLDKASAYRVLGVGANYGKELKDIFTEELEADCTILDISKEALERGQQTYPDMKFVESDMELAYPIQDKFDICLCLRTIQSRGAFRQNVIIQMDKALLNGGLILISIPNGYIDQKNDTVIRGLYDHRTRIVQERRPQVLANKVLNKLQDYGYINTGIETLETEILIWGIKQ